MVGLVKVIPKHRSKHHNVGMFIGRVFLSLMAREAMNQNSREQKMRKLRRDSDFQKCI